MKRYEKNEISNLKKVLEEFISGKYDEWEIAEFNNKNYFLNYKIKPAITQLLDCISFNEYGIPCDFKHKLWAVELKSKDSLKISYEDEGSDSNSGKVSFAPEYDTDWNKEAKLDWNKNIKGGILKIMLYNSYSEFLKIIYKITFVNLNIGYCRRETARKLHKLFFNSIPEKTLNDITPILENLFELAVIKDYSKVSDEIEKLLPSKPIICGNNENVRESTDIKQTKVELNTIQNKKATKYSKKEFLTTKEFAEVFNIKVKTVQNCYKKRLKNEKYYIKSPKFILFKQSAMRAWNEKETFAVKNILHNTGKQNNLITTNHL